MYNIKKCHTYLYCILLIAKNTLRAFTAISPVISIE